MNDHIEIRFVNDIMQPVVKPLTIIYRQKIIACGYFIVGIIFLIYIFILQQPLRIRSTNLYVWKTFQEKIKRPTYINRDHGFCGSCPSDKHFSNAWQLNDIITLISTKNPFLVNIGAASTKGGLYDPTYPILTATNSPFGALLIDPNTDPSLFNAYPKRSNIYISHDYVWSESIIDNIFRKYNISKVFTLLKIDIDSYECSILQTILSSGYQPQLIHVEFNPIFPPPIIFMPIYNPSTKTDWKPPLWSTASPFYGCSLSALSKILVSFNYVLIEVEFWDAIYIRRETAELTQIQIPFNDKIAYEHGFLGHSCLPYCQQNTKLYNKIIDDVIKTTSNQSNLSIRLQNIMDLFAPKSIKNNNLKHPYIISV